LGKFTSHALPDSLVRCSTPFPRPLEGISVEAPSALCPVPFFHIAKVATLVSYRLQLRHLENLICKSATTAQISSQLCNQLITQEIQSTLYLVSPHTPQHPTSCLYPYRNLTVDRTGFGCSPTGSTDHNIPLNNSLNTGYAIKRPRRSDPKSSQ